MKYRKPIIAFCVFTFLITLYLFALVVLDIANVINMNLPVLLAICIGLVIMLIVSFANICVLIAMYDDWKWRHLNKNAKWKH